jgi:hypothetical protein
MSELELQTLLGFNEEDLIANRDCRVSTKKTLLPIATAGFQQGSRNKLTDRSGSGKDYLLEQALPWF